MCMLVKPGVSPKLPTKGFKPSYRCVWHILQIQWQDKVGNEDLWKRAEQQPLLLQVGKRKWHWLGHTLREPFVNVTKHARRWTPQGKQ